VRQPLNAVIGFAEILANGYYGDLNARQKDYVRGILEGGRNLQALVADILDLATIEAGKMALSLNAFDVHTMLANVLGLIRERARDAQITVHFDCPLDIGWMVGDERRLKQVLFNLLANAIRFTPPQGQITLAAQRDADQIVFTVADTGVGIPAGDLSGLFQPFTRGPQPEGSPGGAGLGLSLVKSFVELHGGSVELVSAPLEGTTVTCRLPAGQAEAG
jgi:signal transduction histidine kinase